MLSLAEISVAVFGQARLEEIHDLKETRLYSNVPTEDCPTVTCNKPIGVGWVEVCTQDDVNPTYRLRFVAKGVMRQPMPELYAATPPLDCFVIIMSATLKSAASQGLDVDPAIVLTCDVSRTYPYAPAMRLVYVQVASEDWELGDEARCGKLNVSMHGARGAALNWHHHDSHGACSTVQFEG